MCLTNALREENGSKLEDSLHIMCSIKDTGQDIKKNVKYIKVPFQPFDILMKANHPKTIISVADEESLNVWF